jgi:hypothetical protein
MKRPAPVRWPPREGVGDRLGASRWGEGTA